MPTTYSVYGYCRDTDHCVEDHTLRPGIPTELIPDRPIEEEFEGIWLTPEEANALVKFTIGGNTVLNHKANNYYLSETDDCAIMLALGGSVL